MTSRAVILLLWLFAACVFTAPTAWARSTFAPPAGIGPTTATLGDVLAAARKAYGVKRYTSRIEEGRVTAWGLKGSFRTVESGDDYKSTADYGVISWQEGRVAGQAWRRNPNGIVTMLHDDALADSVQVEALALYSRPDVQLKLLGETSGSAPAYVVEVDPKDGHPTWVFFDKKSFLATRAELALSQARVTHTYSDFHKTGSYTDAWHEHASDGIAQNDVDYVTTSVRYDATITTADTAIADPNGKLVQFPAGVNVVALPAKLVSKQGKTKFVSVENDTHDITQPGNMSSTYEVHTRADPQVVVQLTINGRGYDFLLDSGASGIFIDSDEIDKLGLKTFGPAQQTPYGKWVPSFALLPQLRVGEISMNNVVVNSSPGWRNNPDVGTDIVGAIGYDFLANAVVTIDYEKGAVTATSPFFFVPPADALALQAEFDEGVPYIPVQVGQTQADHFILDTGSPNCFISRSFAQSHADDVKDQGTGVSMNRIWLPQYGFRGVNGVLSVRATEVKSLTISGVAFNEWIMFMELDDRLFDPNEDGIVGYDFLKYFTVYLDYPQNQIFLLPNALARSRAGQ